MAFKKALIERVLGAELSRHLGYSPGDARPQERANHRNGSTGKTVLTDDGPNFISSVTDAVMSEVGAWQERPLEPMYPVVFFDALRARGRGGAQQGHREPAQPVAQDHQDPRALPQRQCGHQADLTSLAQHHEQARAGVARGNEPIRDCLRR